MGDNELKPEEERVIVTNPMVGICHMQVCAVDDATDEEILETCNSENMSGTKKGWTKVIRSGEDAGEFWGGDLKAPVPCREITGRTHFLVGC